MKIGIDARFWNESGVGRYIRNLVAQLQKIDKENTYILFVSKNNYPEIKNPNWKIIQTDIHWHSIKEQIEFPKILDKENLDLVHFPYFSVPIFYHRPFVVTIHDLILHHFATGEATTRSQIVYQLKLMGYKFVIKRSAENALKIITVSQSTKQEIIKHLHIPEEKISVTYEGTENQKKNNQPVKVDKKLEAKNYLLHVGNLYPHKNMNLVLSVLRKIKDQDKLTIQLIIVGREDYFYQRFQKKVKELELQNQIIFLGEITDEMLQGLYQNARGLISPSLMEGFDLPTIEAMENNCLVLASDIPVHREICEDAPLYFHPKSEEDLASKLREVYNNQKEMYKEKIKIGKLRAAQFSWEKMSKETLKLYEDSISLRQSQ